MMRAHPLPVARPGPLLAILLAGALASACGGDDREAASSIKPPSYGGALECRERGCSAIDTRLVLFAGDSFLLEETYRRGGTDDQTYTSRGRWAALADAADPSAGSIVMLSPNVGETRRFRMLGDSALRQLDRQGKEFRSAHNQLLRRTP